MVIHMSLSSYIFSQVIENEDYEVNAIASDSHLRQEDFDNHPAELCSQTFTRENRGDKVRMQHEIPEVKQV